MAFNVKTISFLKSSMVLYLSKVYDFMQKPRIMSETTFLKFFNKVLEKKILNY